jgi:hypothetical protein
VAPLLLLLLQPALKLPLLLLLLLKENGGVLQPGDLSLQLLQVQLAQARRWLLLLLLAWESCSACCMPCASWGDCHHPCPLLPCWRLCHQLLQLMSLLLLQQQLQVPQHHLLE